MQEHTLILKINLPGHRVLAGLGALAVLVVGIGTVLAAVDDDPGTSSLLSGGIVVPYDGYLMIDNGPANGSRDVIFELWDDPVSADAAHRIWSESHTGTNSNAVTFYNGRFSVGLGTGTKTSTKTINEALLDGEQLYLAIQVADSTGTLVQLSGRQAIEAVPYAAWSANSADFRVAGNLTVAGTATVTGDTTMQSNAYVTGNAFVSGDGDVTGDATVDGNATVGGTLGVTGATTLSSTLSAGVTTVTGLTVNGTLATNPKLVAFHSVYVGGSGWVNTTISATDWNCSIGGLAMVDGDIEENGTHDPILAYTYINAGQWWVRADFVSHNNHEETALGLVCFRVSISERASWF